MSIRELVSCPTGTFLLSIPCSQGPTVFGQTQHGGECCPRISQETSPCDCQAPCRATSPCPAVEQEICLVWTRCDPPGNDAECSAPDANRHGCRGLKTNAWRCALCRWEDLAYWDYCGWHSREQQLTSVSADFIRQTSLLCLLFLPLTLDWSRSSAALQTLWSDFPYSRWPVVCSGRRRQGKWPQKRWLGPGNEGLGCLGGPEPSDWKQGWCGLNNF